MAMAGSPSAIARPLAQQLLRTRGQGIAVFVQQRVHSTTVGLEATSAFVQQLLTELESALEVLREQADPNELVLEDEQEVELGSLLSASSLTIRYATEREALVPVVGRFRAAFQVVLRYPLWTKALLGLKMVSIMGLTRLLESFGEHEATSQVAGDLDWMFKRFSKAEASNPNDFTQRVNFLFRPACEQLTVAIQSHPSSHQAIYDDIIPLLMQLTAEFDDTITDPVATELLSTIAIVFDLRLPPPMASAFALLPLPTFAESETSDEHTNIHILQREDGDEKERPSVQLPGGAILSTFSESIVRWMGDGSRQLGVISNLSHICAAFHLKHENVQQSTVCETLLSCVQSLSLESRADFERCLAMIECIRDVGLRDALPTGLEKDLFNLLKEIMPRLQVALKTLKVDAADLRSIKATCSTIRDVLVEAFLVYIHYAARANGLIESHLESISAVIAKLADPRIHGDLLFTARKFLDETAFADAVDAAVAPLLKAVKQLDRYSKIAAKRIVSGIARLAVGAGPAISSYAEALSMPLLDPFARGFRKGRDGYLSALGCLMLSCSRDASYPLDEYDWIRRFVTVLLEASASNKVHAMNILDQLVRSDTRIRAIFARAAASSQGLVEHIVQTTLSSWPLYAEDMDAVHVLLSILASLVVEKELQVVVGGGQLTQTLSQLRENAEADNDTDLAEACSAVLRALSSS